MEIISGLILGASIGFCAACTLARRNLIAGVFNEDKIEGLSSDLDSAIEVAYNRGAHDWVRLNYPNHFDALVKSGF